MNGRTKLTIMVVGIFTAIGIAVVGYLVWHHTNTDHKVSKQQKSSGLAKTPVVPPGQDKVKRACDLLDTATVSKTIGAGASKSDDVVEVIQPDYRSTGCDFANADKHIRITLYRFRTAEEAVAGKVKVQTTQIVASKDGKTTTTQPRQSAVGIKDKAVVTVTVTNGSVFDSSASQTLVDSALKRL